MPGKILQRPQKNGTQLRMEKQKTQNSQNNPVQKKNTRKVSQSLTSSSTTELQYCKQPGIGIRTDRRTNETKSKTWILIHTPSNT